MSEVKNRKNDDFISLNTLLSPGDYLGKLCHISKIVLYPRNI